MIIIFNYTIDDQKYNIKNQSGNSQPLPSESSNIYINVSYHFSFNNSCTCIPFTWFFSINTLPSGDIKICFFLTARKMPETYK